MKKPGRVQREEEARRKEEGGGKGSKGKEGGEGGRFREGRRKKPQNTNRFHHGHTKRSYRNTTPVINMITLLRYTNKRKGRKEGKGASSVSYSCVSQLMYEGYGLGVSMLSSVDL